MKTLGKAIANKIALVLSQYFQLPPGYLMGVIPNGSVAKFENQTRPL